MGCQHHYLNWMWQKLDNYNEATIINGEMVYFIIQANGNTILDQQDAEA